MRFRPTLTPYLFCILFCTIAFVSCEKTLEEERTYAEDASIVTYIGANKYTMVGDVYCVPRIPSYGYQPNKGDTVTFWYIGYTLDGKIFDTNVDGVAKKAKLNTLTRSFEPVTIIAGNGVLVEGLDEGMMLVSENEVATILFPSSLGFGQNAIGPIPQWSSLAYDIELLKVNGAGIQKEKAYIEGLNLTRSGYTLDTSGLFYKYLVLGTDSTPTIKNDTVYGWYKGTLPDSTVIKDLGEGSQQIILSNSDIPAGVRLGFMLTKNGGSAKLVLPSFLGFGNKGLGDVGPYQTLFYEIRLDSIK